MDYLIVNLNLFLMTLFLVNVTSSLGCYVGHHTQADQLKMNVFFLRYSE